MPVLPKLNESIRRMSSTTCACVCCSVSIHFEKNYEEATPCFDHALAQAWTSLAKRRESLACQVTSPYNNKLGCFMK